MDLLRTTTLTTPPEATVPGPPRPSGTNASRTRRPDRALAGRLLRGRSADPAWARAGLAVLLLATALLYLWDLGASGWANSFYAAAAQAGSVSWKAFLFGASDAAGSITVDKSPLALWPMDLSVRIFGLSSWSILVPQALEGVATVAILHRAVRRATGSAGAGLLAGAAMALTPVAVLMFRFDNPDAMLVLLLTGAASATLRAVEEARAAGAPRRWLVLAGALVGLAFLAKMLQAFLVLPALVLVYLLCAGTPVLRRLADLLVAFAAMLVAGGWWVALVEAWPASDRPWIGGSQHNSVLELIVGYNGVGRLDGNETGSVGGGGGPGGSMWGRTGLTRLFSGEIGGQASWLLPAALVLGVAALWWARRDGRLRAALGVWLGWLVVTGLTFSLMAGIFHAYYTVALTPALGALVGIGGHVLWQHRAGLAARMVLAATAGGTAVWAIVLLGRSSEFLPWLRPLLLVGGLLVSAALVLSHVAPRRWALVIAAAAVLVGLAGPASYAVDTALTPHTGSIPSAGPSVQGGSGPGGFGGTPPGRLPARAGATTGGGPTGRGSTGGMGGLLDGSTSTPALTRVLSADAGSYTWVAAAIGSNNASGYQLATELPVMAIGGFNGSDPSPTLAQFEQYVAAGRIHWFIGGGQGGPGGGPGGSTSTAITQWVQAHFAATTVDGVTLYDLSGGAS
ncbi:MAG: ArnT family glycosyltransferase [Marmoricola sp.]